jgi:predicted dehydrogenase
VLRPRRSPAQNEDTVTPVHPAPAVTVSLAGAGHIAAVHALAASELGLRVTHVASRTTARAAELATELGARTCALTQLPAGAGLVVVATPPPWHAAPAMAALQGGATVLVEKPFTATLADADRLVDAEAAGARVLYGENLLHAPVFATAAAHIGTLGALHHLEARLLMPRPDWGETVTGRWGGGALFDVGSHPLGLVLAAVGPHDPPVSVSARLQRRPGDRVDDHGEAEVTFASGVRATVVASWRHETRVRDLQAASATGVVRAELLPDRSLEVDGARVGLPEVPADPTHVRLQEFGFLAQLGAAAVLAGDTGPAAAGPARKVRPGAAFGRQVLEVLCAAYASAGAGGAVVPLPFTGDRRRTPLEHWHGG